MKSAAFVIRPRGEDGYRVFSVRIPQKTVDRLEEVSRQTNRSRNELIGVFLEYALDHLVVQEKENEK